MTTHQSPIIGHKQLVPIHKKFLPTNNFLPLIKKGHILYVFYIYMLFPLCIISFMCYFFYMIQNSIATPLVSTFLYKKRDDRSRLSINCSVINYTK